MAHRQTSYEMIETCNSLWVFDASRHRFLRLSRLHPQNLAFVPESAWTPYVTLTINADTGEFLATLNESGTRLVRSQRHTTPCPFCLAGLPADATRELEQIRESRP